MIWAQGLGYHTAPFLKMPEYFSAALSGRYLESAPRIFALAPATGAGEMLSGPLLLLGMIHFAMDIQKFMSIWAA